MCICVYILTYMNNSFEIGAANGVLGGRWSIWRAVGAPISNERAPAFTVQGKLRQGAREHTSLGYQMSETDSLSTGIYNVKHSERECLGPFHQPGSSHDPRYRHVCLEQSPTRKGPAPDPVIANRDCSEKTPTWKVATCMTALNRQRREAVKWLKDAQPKRFHTFWERSKIISLYFGP